MTSCSSSFKWHTVRRFILTPNEIHCTRSMLYCCFHEWYKILRQNVNPPSGFITYFVISLKLFDESIAKYCDGKLRCMYCVNRVFAITTELDLLFLYCTVPPLPLSFLFNFQQLIQHRIAGLRCFIFVEIFVSLFTFNTVSVQTLKISEGALSTKTTKLVFCPHSWK